jgi:hypothetical protein
MRALCMATRDWPTIVLGFATGALVLTGALCMAAPPSALALLGVGVHSLGVLSAWTWRALRGSGTERCGEWNQCRVRCAAHSTSTPKTT